MRREGRRGEEGVTRKVRREERTGEEGREKGGGGKGEGEKKG